MSIVVANLTKEYGIQKAVNDVSFSVNKGEIVGFIGPNGAGKSTTMKIITGYIRNFTGTVEVNGLDLSKNIIRYISKCMCVNIFVLLLESIN